jgi:uncharacterized protein YutE (UPF0331/DUF86 family)
LVDGALVTSKLSELADRVGQVRKHAKADPAALAAERDALELVSFNLMLAVQSCADIASHIIADEGWSPAGSLADGFARLASQGVITPPTQLALARAVGLRDVVAHGYAGLDAAAVHSASTAGVADLDRFAKEIATWLGSRG